MKSKLQAALEAKGSLAKKVPLKVRILGRPTTIHVSEATRDQYWPSFIEIARKHFATSASELVEQYIVQTVLEHQENPQARLNGFIAHPEMPALPTIGRGAKVNWQDHADITLHKVLQDTDQIRLNIGAEMQRRRKERDLTGLDPYRTQDRVEAERRARKTLELMHFTGEDLEKELREIMRQWEARHGAHQEQQH